MGTIYELTENYKAVEALLCDEEVDEQTVLDTLEAIEGRSRTRQTIMQR